MARRLVGVLGGMGPLATVDFMGKIIAGTVAKRDQDHIPLIIHSVPQIPDRTDAIRSGSDEPFRVLKLGVGVLEGAGAELIVIPCNTAHAWFDRLAASTSVRMIHIAEAVRNAFEAKLGSENEKVALMATVGTVKAGFYQRYLSGRGRAMIIPSAAIQDDIDNAISAVKGGDIARCRDLGLKAGTALMNEGATTLLLACTELPIALTGTGLEQHCMDATDCLARACIKFSLSDLEV